MRTVAIGQTTVTIAAGDRKAGIRILVNELVEAFDTLRPDQVFVARPIHFAQGDTVRLALPRGPCWLKYNSLRDGDAPPTINLTGSGRCQVVTPLEVFIVRKDAVATRCTVDGPAAVELAHGKLGATTVEGFVMLDRSGGFFLKPARR